MQNLSALPFESLKQTNEHGAEYWSARALQKILGYEEWRKFENTIFKAIQSCEGTENKSENHFVSADKMVTVGSKTKRNIKDYHLSRFACYLIAQNGDPRKPEIATAQHYFAVQTRKQELTETLAADFERIELRKQTAEEFKALSSAAKVAGVQSTQFGIFHDAGYKGLYGGLGSKQIKARKRIPEKDQLLDRMSSTELAANQFRMTQTRDKLKREGIQHASLAIQTHEKIGKEVRTAIQRIGGTLPENLPAQEHIREVHKRLSTQSENALPPTPPQKTKI